MSARLLTTTQLTSTAWRRLFRDVYADAALPDTHETAIAGAALIVPETDRFGPVTGLRVRRTAVPDHDVRTVRRLSCTVPVRTALDLARFEGLTDSVPALDVLLARGLVLPDHLAEAAASLVTGRGTDRARRAVALADGRFVARVDLHSRSAGSPSSTTARGTGSQVSWRAIAGD